MSVPINIEELRNNLGHNCEVERKLLAEFVESSQKMLASLRRAPAEMRSDTYNKAWKKNIQQIKETAIKIGAARLAEMAARAEQQFEADAIVKEHLLELVTREFTETEHFIVSVIGSDA